MREGRRSGAEESGEKLALLSLSCAVWAEGSREQARGKRGREEGRHKELQGAALHTRILRSVRRRGVCTPEDAEQKHYFLLVSVNRTRSFE